MDRFQFFGSVYNKFYIFDRFRFYESITKVQTEFYCCKKSTLKGDGLNLVWIWSIFCFLIPVFLTSKKDHVILPCPFLLVLQ